MWFNQHKTATNISLSKRPHLFFCGYSLVTRGWKKVAFECYSVESERAMPPCIPSGVPQQSWRLLASSLAAPSRRFSAPDFSAILKWSEVQNSATSTGRIGAPRDLQSRCANGCNRSNRAVNVKLVDKKSSLRKIGWCRKVSLRTSSELPKY